MVEVGGTWSGPVWRLLRGEEPIGEIHVTHDDFPWLNGRFVALDGFGDVQALFEDELALADSADESGDESDEQAWQSAYRRITGTLTLVAPDGTPAAEFLLHIDGANAWFRWNDEPFDTDDDTADRRQDRHHA